MREYLGVHNVLRYLTTSEGNDLVNLICPNDQLKPFGLLHDVARHAIMPGDENLGVLKVLHEFTFCEGRPAVVGRLPENLHVVVSRVQRAERLQTARAAYYDLQCADLFRKCPPI